MIVILFIIVYNSDFICNRSPKQLQHFEKIIVNLQSFKNHDIFIIYLYY